MRRIPLCPHGSLNLPSQLESIRTLLRVTFGCSRRTGLSGRGIRGSSCVPEREHEREREPVPEPVPLRMCLSACACISAARFWAKRLILTRGFSAHRG